MEQNQVPIVCDTNIWYRLSDGRISPQEVEGKRLVGTYINGIEFCSTRNLYSNFDQLRQAVNAFGKYASGCYAGAPVEHVKMISGYEWDRSQWEDIDIFLNGIVMTKSAPDPNLARELVREYSEKIQEGDQPFLEIIAKHRMQINSKGVHKRRMNEIDVRLEHKQKTKHLLQTTVLQGLSVDWKLLDLFVSTFDEWLRQLSVQDSLIMKLNDWNDLLNLIYVSPGSLYWTEDHRRTTEFIYNSNCGHYLYQNAIKNNG